MVDGCPVVRHATLTMVDLAGNDRKPAATTASSPYTFAINLSLSKLRKVANELALAQAQAQALEYNNSNNDDDDDKDEDDYNNNNNGDDEDEEDGYGHQALDSDDDDDSGNNRRRRSQRARASGGIMRVTTILHSSPITTHPLSHHSIIRFHPPLDRHNHRPSPAILSYKESVLTFLH